jgi:uncharacterized membrane protein YraQ (UPF0718 family)
MRMKGSRLTRYLFPLIALAAAGLFVALFPDRGGRAVEVTLFSLREMLLVIPPVFLLLGLLDVWVPRETMTRFMGEGSGLRGVVLAIFLGSAAAGPLYGAFPVAAVFMKKGVTLRNVFIFLGAWSTTKIPMFLFELSALGPRFALTRLAVDIPGIVLIAWALVRILRPEESERIVQRLQDAD